MEKQVKSRERITEHGEVFTAAREVNAMLDLVKQETERIDSRFLEPACGTGNFLVEILKRKLAVVSRRYKRSQLDYETYAFIAVSSIYGIDLQKDNVEECRNRLFSIFDEEYTELFQGKCKNNFRKSIIFLLEKNIIKGDALSLTTEKDGNQPIIFSEWSMVTNGKIKRRDYSFRTLLPNEKPKPTKDLELFPDFVDDGDGSVAGVHEISDIGEDVFIPEPVAKYPLTDFLRLSENV